MQNKHKCVIILAMSAKTNNVEGQMNMFSPSELDVSHLPLEQQLNPDAIVTPFRQDLLEYYQRQQELHLPSRREGKNEYSLLSLIGVDASSYRAHYQGDGKAQHALTMARRSPEDIRHAADRYQNSLGELAVRFSDIAAASNMKTGHRVAIDKLPLAESDKVYMISEKEQAVDRYIGGVMLPQFKKKFLQDKKPDKVRKATAKKLKKGIELQQEMRLQVDIELKAKQGPRIFGDNHYRHD